MPTKKYNLLKEIYWRKVSAKEHLGNYLQSNNPNYPEKDYTDYSAWLQGVSTTIRDFRKWVLIGANKIWDTIDDFTAKIEPFVRNGSTGINGVNSILITPEETKFTISDPRHRNHYRYKNLYIENQRGIIVIRAVDVDEYPNLEYLAKDGETTRIESSRRELQNLMKMFKELHRGILEEKVEIITPRIIRHLSPYSHNF